MISLRVPDAHRARTRTTGGTRRSLASRIEGRPSMQTGVEPSEGRFFRVLSHLNTNWKVMPLHQFAHSIEWYNGPTQGRLL